MMIYEQIEQLQSHMTELTGVSNFTTQQLNALRTDHSTVSTKLESALQKLIALTKTFQLKEAECSAQQQQIAQLQERVTTADAELSAARNELRSVHRVVTGHEQTIREHELELKQHITTTQQLTVRMRGCNQSRFVLIPTHTHPNACWIIRRHKSLLPVRPSFSPNS